VAIVRISQVHIHQVVIDQFGPIFAELIELLTDCLQRLGVEVSHAPNVTREDRPNLIVGATCFLAEPWLTAIARCPSPVIVFQSEILDEERGFLPRFQPYWRFLQGAQHIWDYSETNVRYLDAMGTRGASYVRLGYSPRMQRIQPAATQDIDVLFYGAGSPRRARVVSEMRRLGLETVHAFNCFGAERDRLIARAKINLNVHQFERAPLEQLRITYLLNNRCCVVSETSDTDSYGGGVVFAPLDELPARCAELLAPGMESVRHEVAERGFAALEAIPMLESVRAALARVEAGSTVRVAGDR